MQMAIAARKPRAPAPPSRRALLDDANRAVDKGRIKAAIGHYLRALEHHGPDPAIDARLAALYVKLKQLPQAHQYFQSAAAQFMLAGFEEKALAVFRNAVACFPRNVELWEAIAGLHRGRRCIADAVKTLLEGRHKFRKRSLRPQAIRLLRQVVELEPTHADATFDLAVLLAKVGQPDAAGELLAGLAERLHGRRLRRVRGALFRLCPTPTTAWLWLRAATVGR